MDSLKDLIKNIRHLVKRNCPILIDQEGGRVQRLTRPHFLKYPPAKVFGDVASFNINDAQKAVYLNYSLIGKELINVGINVNCAPCIDVLSEETHEIIGDRAFSGDELIVSKLGQSACEGLMNNGVIPIIKHMPGHGKANADSHMSLPVVSNSLRELEKKDFYPFKYLSKCPMAMTAHITYSHIDSLNPITTSKKAYHYIRNKIKYSGILITDDICMKALSGSIKNKIENINNAGYDLILHCSGKENELKDVLEFSPIVNDDILEKWFNALKMLKLKKSKNNNYEKNEINRIFYKYLGFKWDFQ